ncbi:hypothetical protein KKF91_03045, partial [Myxococcota bacterium]|nr:hypothetical protein [Myxococcota bacterium]MBU1429517.1 hypothetical protein [Myxococcota bacterium]MBU1896574.1 hypothetical protein [Myxococcota bacterium]
LSLDLSGAAPSAVEGDGPEMAFTLNPGLYWTLAAGQQLLFEHSLTFEADTSPDDVGRLALGYNHLFGAIELLTELGYEAEVFDARLAFIATLPVGGAQ